MQAFRATYTPRAAIDYNSKKAEVVVVLEVFHCGDTSNNHKAAILRGDGKNSLDIVPIDCLTECHWPSGVPNIEMS